MICWTIAGIFTASVIWFAYLVYVAPELNEDD